MRLHWRAVVDVVSLCALIWHERRKHKHVRAPFHTNAADQMGAKLSKKCFFVCPESTAGELFPVIRQFTLHGTIFSIHYMTTHSEFRFFNISLGTLKTSGFRRKLRVKEKEKDRAARNCSKSTPIFFGHRMSCYRDHVARRTFEYTNPVCGNRKVTRARTYRFVVLDQRIEYIRSANLLDPFE